MLVLLKRETNTLCHCNDPCMYIILLSLLNVCFLIIIFLPKKGGDFTNHNGTGGEGIWGEKWKDENFELAHKAPGTLR